MQVDFARKILRLNLAMIFDCSYRLKFKISGFQPRLNQVILTFIYLLILFYRTLGTPDENLWPGVSDLPDYKSSFPKWPVQNLLQVIPSLGQPGADLLQVRSIESTFLLETFELASVRTKLTFLLSEMEWMEVITFTLALAQILIERFCLFTMHLNILVWHSKFAVTVFLSSSLHSNCLHTNQ